MSLNCSSKNLRSLYSDDAVQNDGESVYDVLPSKSIIADDLLTVVEGQSVSASFKNTFPAYIVGKGIP